MARWAQVRAEWDGTNRHVPATLTFSATNGAQFDVGYGIGYVVRPGGGTTGNDGERLKGITLTPSQLTIEWHETGGQNYTIQLQFVDTNKDMFQVGVSGCLRIAAQGHVSHETDHLP